MKISVVINTRNEAEKLKRTLDSVKKIADEVVIVDMHSDDGTIEIAEKFGAKVFLHKPINYVEPARNFAIEKACGEWILVLDPDEEISASLAKKLKEIAESEDSADFYRLPRQNIIFGKWIRHSRWWPDYNIRFFKKGKVIWSEIIHCVPETYGKGLDLDAIEENAIVHRNYDSVDGFLERMTRYSTIQARLLDESGYEFYWQDLIKKPVSEFLSRYFSGQGYKDGVHGLALAALQAFSEFVVYLKVWQENKFKEQSLGIKETIGVMKEAESDIHYWQANTLINEKGSVLQRVKRKFKLA